MLTLIHLRVNFHRVFNGNGKFAWRIDGEKMNTHLCGNFIVGKVRHRTLSTCVF